jgi:predicted unusual protein kinase regulating ubiquinone biosynthesis (AarF/ABC1/UbiB family)
VRLALAPAELDVPRAAGSSASTALPPLFNKIEKALETVSKDPQALLEAVVGLPSGMATYDRERVTDYFQQRPALMVTRALDFLLAFRRVRAAWAAEGVDRGAVLRAELSALGPVAVKVGQTLSQRPDILPEDVCVALKSLQTSNKPFSNEEAYRVMAEDFGAKGPLAPGIPATEGCDPNGPTLFKRLSADCIASASLGQVYRGETHDGQEIAVKVQRPGALRQCLLDGSVIIVALKAIQGRYWNGDLLAIFDGVAAGIVQELDFRNEAANGDAFRSSLEFLGYVDVPRTIPELTTRRAMAMEWVRGRHLSDLSPEEAMRMTYMACEAVTAGLVLTGLVHADPH